MKKYSFIFFVLPMLFFPLIYGCGTEPDETPSLMEEIVGNYSYPGINFESGNITRGLQSDSLTNLKIYSNNTYTLYLQSDSPINDSIFLVRQQGTFEIPVSKIMKGKGAWGNTYYYFQGKIYFYPDHEDYWGGKFNLYISPSTLVFSPPIKIGEMYNGDLIFYNWKQ